MWEKIKDRARAFGQWFDTKRRQAVQAAIASVAPLLIMLGLVTGGEVEAWSLIVGAVLSAVGPLVSLVNLTRSQFAGWLVTGARGVLYGAAAVIVPALVSLGLIDDSQATSTLALLSTSLTVLASVVAIFTSAQQQALVSSDRAVVSTLTAPLSSQIADLSAAASRLGLSPNEVTREMYRQATRE